MVEEPHVNIYIRKHIYVNTVYITVVVKEPSQILGVNPNFDKWGEYKYLLHRVGLLLNEIMCVKCLTLGLALG